MTTRNRATLRGYFSAGKLPTQDNFGDLIESMLNMDDEGFRKSEKNGFEISTLQKNDALISFYREQDKQKALWSIAYGNADELVFNAPGLDSATGAKAPPVPVLALDRHQRVGVGTAEPKQALDVVGTIVCTARIGRAPDPRERLQAMADGEWHDLTGNLQGCQAIEVMACAGYRKSGRCAMLHATALNTGNPRLSWLDLFGLRRRIRQQSMWFGKRCDQLELRWAAADGRAAGYKLQVRSKCNYGPGVAIRATLTHLWVDDEKDIAP